MEKVRVFLKQDGEEFQGQGYWQKQGEDYQLQFTYKEEDSTVEVLFIHHNDGTCSIREFSKEKELYLYLQEGWEEGYLKTTVGMMLFVTKLEKIEQMEKEDQRIYEIGYQLGQSEADSLLHEFVLIIEKNSDGNE